MKIQKIKIHNFRSIDHLELNLEGKNLEIKGRNSKGKSTVFQAWTWLWFGKIIDQTKLISKFNIKPKDKTNVETYVEIKFIHDNQEYEVTRLFRELHVKKQGELEKTFEGHTTEYFINNTKQGTEKAFKKFVDKFFTEEEFFLLSNPNYFDAIKWDKKRDIIISFLDQDTLPDFNTELKSFKDSAKKQNKELERIDIQLKTLEDQKTKDLPEYDKVIEDYTNILDKIRKEEENDKLKNKQILIEKNKYYKELENLENILSELKKEERLTNSKLDKIIFEKDNQKNKEEEIKRKKVELEKAKVDLGKSEKGLESLYKKYTEINSSKFEISINDKKCKACNQYLPKNLQEEKINKLKNNFDKEKESSLRLVKKEGRLEKEKKESIQKSIVSLGNEINRLGIQGIVDDNKSDDLSKDLKKLKEEEEEVLKLKKDWENKLKNIVIPENGGLKELNQRKEALLTTKASIEAQQKISERIKKLEEDRKKKSLKHMELKEKINNKELEIKQYMGNKNNELKEKFPGNISFKLFEIQINSGVKPTFDIMHKGISWGAPLNPGAKIETGLCLIKELQKVKGIELPVWVDNFESYTEKINLPNQIIRIIAEKSELKFKIGGENDEN